MEYVPFDKLAAVRKALKGNSCGPKKLGKILDALQEFATQQAVGTTTNTPAALALAPRKQVSGVFIQFRAWYLKHVHPFDDKEVGAAKKAWESYGEREKDDWILEHGTDNLKEKVKKKRTAREAFDEHDGIQLSALPM